LVDISSPDFEERIRTVEDILATLNLGRKERLIVFNKIDKIEGPFLKYVEDRYKAVSISSLKKTGIDRLIGVIEAKLAQVEP